MLLAGLLLVAYLLGTVVVWQLPALFLVGVGIIFCIMAVLKSRAPAKYEMSPRVTLAYGILAIIIGALWLAISIEGVLALYVLAVVLIVFGVVFVAYTKLH